jgi:hypothetical protein
MIRPMEETEEKVMKKATVDEASAAPAMGVMWSTRRDLFQRSGEVIISTRSHDR